MNRGPVLLLAVTLMVLGMAVWVWSRLTPEAPLIDPADRERVTVLPLPTDLALRGGSLPLDQGLAVQLVGHSEPRLERAVERMRTRLPEATRGSDNGAPFTIDVAVAADDGDPLWIDESYALDIRPDGARLRAATPVGALRGLQTFVQLVESDDRGVRVPAARIRDAPRFRWRGILVDVCRHWIPKDVILRNLDAMEAAKMNVLHLHLTDDQAFRVESLLYPRLHEVGSGGDYFTQDDLREIVAYAHDRGIRVVPEFDLPGHSLSWLEAYPELAIDPGPWAKTKQYGIHPVALDPTRDEVYAFLDAFLDEMATIFPDPVVHIGGDEANPERWNANERVQAYQREHGLADHKDLQAYFDERLHGILAGHGKQMMGWEEIQHGALPKDVIVQAWVTPRSVADAVGNGYQAVLSQGYYLDHKRSAATHYGIDPLGVPEPILIPTDGPWQSWAIELDTPAGKMDGVLVIHGEGEELTGWSAAQGGVIPLQNVRFDGALLTATAESPIGTIEMKAAVDGNSISGEMGSMVFSAQMVGRRVGGDDLPGTSPPDLQKAAHISPEARHRVLGGEAAMWSELVTAETIDSRLWPRSGAIAERLWSPAESADDVDDMYRRLDVFSVRLERLGIAHESFRASMLAGMAEGRPPEALGALVSVLEEVKGYERSRFGEDGLTTETPLDRVADAAGPESRAARRFSMDVDALLAGDEARRAPIEAALVSWRDQHRELSELFASSERVAAVEPLSLALARAAALGLEALAAMEAGTTLERGDAARRAEVLRRTDVKADGALLAVGPALRRLVEAASGPATSRPTETSGRR